MKPRSSAARPPAVIHGLTRGARPDREHDPATRPQDARDLGGGALHVGDEHQPEAADDPVDRRIGAARGLAASSTANSTPLEAERGRTRGERPRPSRAPHPSRAASPPGWISGSTSNPVSPGPGRELEDRWPGAGSSSSIIRAESTAVARANSSRCRSQPGGDAAPGLDLLRRDVVYAATPLKAGMMRSP